MGLGSMGLRPPVWLRDDEEAVARIDVAAVRSPLNDHRTLACETLPFPLRSC